jgi:ribosome recycling factor
MLITCYPLPRRAAWGTARFLLQHQTRWLGNPRLYSARSRKEKKDVDLNRPPRDEHGRIDVSLLVPGSKMVLNPPEQLVFDAAEKKMKKIVETCRHEIKDMEFRASGRVTPELLSPVRVELGGDKPARLDEVATVGVRDGTTLIVTIFDESVCFLTGRSCESTESSDKMLKDIERAIYAAKLPHITPQRVDGRTLRIPVPK